MVPAALGQLVVVPATVSAIPAVVGCGDERERLEDFAMVRRR